MVCETVPPGMTYHLNFEPSSCICPTNMFAVGKRVAERSTRLVEPVFPSRFVKIRLLSFILPHVSALPAAWIRSHESGSSR